jgi:hypothetical protein
MKQLKNSLNRFLSLSILTLLLTVSAFAQTTLYCAQSDIEGFEEEHKNGNQYVSEDSTTTLSKLEFYATVKDEQLFLQSNYQPATSKFPYKLMTSQNLNDMKVLAGRLLTFAGRHKLPGGFDSAYSKDAVLYIDIALLKSSKYKDVNFGKIKNVYLVDNKDGKWALKTFGARKYVEVSSKVNLEIPISDAQKFSSFTDNIQNLDKNLRSSFDRENVKVLPLVNDLDTQEAAASKLSPEHLIKMSSFTMDDFSRVFKENKGKKIFLLGHFDNSKEVFVATDEYGKTLSELNFKELEKIARTHDVRLYPLGCETGKHLEESGALNTFNSVDAVNRLQEALQSASWADFFNKLGNDDLEFVVKSSFIENGDTRIDVDIIKRDGGRGGNGGGTPEIVGTLRFWIPKVGKFPPVAGCDGNSNRNSTNGNCNTNTGNRNDSTSRIPPTPIDGGGGIRVTPWGIWLIVIGFIVVWGIAGFVLQRRRR